MTEIISVVSGKGGVGKTTLVSNLAVALTKLGGKVLVIDGNVSGANLGIHLGVPSVYPVSLNDVLHKDAFITQAIYRHASGFNIIPASLNALGANSQRLKHVMYDILGDYDAILIDASAGVNKEMKSALEASDSCIIITNPELPALSNALLAKKEAQKLNIPIKGIVINKSTGQKYEVNDKDVIDFLELPVLGKIKDHRKVRESIAIGKPILEHRPHNTSSYGIRTIAHKISGIEPPKRTIIDSLKGFIDDIR
ncbi:MAG: cell division ATPase MinD [Candidatus Aenigmarchaeota archaeon]|nr:cell division ATPase MinD [Candidatus Aenigmarchaeota archaeon]MCK5373517.1 cell division ATPase MinD [Candidatus Aenigmarchaeota archaeon]